MILIDTGPIVAIINRGDAHHESVAVAVLKITDRLCTTEACLTEAIYLIGRSAGWPGIELLRRAVLNGIIEIIKMNQDGHSQAFAYMERYRDQPCDYADATLLIAAEETGSRYIFTIDKHFHAYRLANGESLQVITG